MKAQTVTIIGLDRVGASIGLALQESTLPLTIVGNDQDGDRAQEAQEIGAVDSVKRNMRRAASVADILILTAPVSDLEDTLQIIGDAVQEQTLVIDLSGLKGPGLSWANKYFQQGHYIGAKLVLAAEGLADGRFDTALADPALFQNSLFCLMPGAQVEPEAVETAVNFGRLLGAVPYFLEAAEYDNLVQGTETLPGLVAAALFSTINKAGGWRDMLRFAGLPFALSTLPLTNEANIAHLALNNKEATLRWLNAMIEEMEQVRQWVYEGEKELLSARMVELNVTRERWLEERAKNEWSEVEAPNSGVGSFTQHLFGGLTRVRGQDDD